MKRDEFLKRGIQAGLLALISFMIFFLRERIDASPSCTGCPESGACPGRTVCRK